MYHLENATTNTLSIPDGSFVRRDNAFRIPYPCLEPVLGVEGKLVQLPAWSARDLCYFLNRHNVIRNSMVDPDWWVQKGLLTLGPVKAEEERKWVAAKRAVKMRKQAQAKAA